MSDLISRTKLFNKLAYIKAPPEANEYKAAVYSLIQSMETADRPTGRWVMKQKEINDCDGYRTYYWYECDNCGARPPKDQWGREWHSDFCPNCGAKMRGEEECV